MGERGKEGGRERGREGGRDEKGRRRRRGRGVGDKGKKAEWGDWVMKEEGGKCEEQREGEGRGGNKREEEIIREGGCFLSSVPEE